MTAPAKLQFADLEKVGPGTPAGTYLRKYWQPVYRASDLPPKRPKPIEILAEKFTLYRGESGAIHMVEYGCPHRGAPMLLGWVEGDNLRCRYHGWKFDGTGQCIEQPDLDVSSAHRVKMRSYPVREYLGLVFAYLGESEPPEFITYPDFEKPGVIVTDPQEVVPCTFWNRLDNDIVHIPWVHRATALRKGRLDFIVPRREIVDETPYGWKSTRIAKNKTTNMRDMSGSAHFFMPNSYQFGVRTRIKGFDDRDLWDTKLTWTVPVNDTKFVAFDVTHTPLAGEEGERYAQSKYQQFETEAEDRWDLAEAVLAGEITLEELPDELSAYTAFAIEDYVTQVGQGTVAARGQENLVETDRKVTLTRRLWLQEIEALQAGKPLSKWKMPAEPLQVLAAE